MGKHTLPDYTTKYKMATVFGNIDQGELAARLSSPNTFDRRGNVVWMDDFEAANLHWIDESSGPGASAALATDNVYRGEQACKLVTGTAVNTYGMISRYFDLPPSVGLGFEFSITGQYLSSTFELIILVADGTTFSQAKIKYVGSDKELFYLDDTNTYQSLGVVSPFGITPLWFTTIKLVVDYATQRYIRLLKGITTFDLSSYGLYTIESPASPSIRVELKHTTLSTTSRFCYIDDFIITQNEP